MRQKMKATVELHKKGFRLLRIIHEIDRNMLPRTILESIINAFIPYISLSTKKANFFRFYSSLPLLIILLSITASTIETIA